VDLMLTHNGAEQPAETADGDKYTKEALIFPEIQTEWKTFRSYLSKQPKETLYLQLTELTTSDMLRVMFPNISTLANICLSIPVSTASVERSFSQMKLIKTRIRNRIGQSGLSYLMKIAIETPEKLSDSDLDATIRQGDAASELLMKKRRLQKKGRVEVCRWFVIDRASTF